MNTTNLNPEPEETAVTPFTRRTFLKTVGAGLAAAPLAGVLAPLASAAAAEPRVPSRSIPARAVGRPTPKLEEEPPLPPARRLGFAVVGLGNFALNQIIPSFAESKKSRLTALVSDDRDKGLKIAREQGVKESNVLSYADFDRLANLPDVDIVYIILPNALHAEYTVRALGAGKHVMCEKPMATNVEDCRRMIAAAQNANRKLMIAYRAQYEPFNLEMIRIARAQEFGKLKLIVADHGRIADPALPSDQWRLQKSLSGGGSLVDIGIYSLQAARYISGEEPVEISANSWSTPGDARFREVEESMQWTMRFPSGVIANCSCSYDHYDVKRYRAFATEGWFDLDPATDYYRHRLTTGSADPRDKNRTVVEERQIKEGNQFAAEMDHLSECVTQNKTPKTPGQEGLRDVQLMQLIYQAAREGRALQV